jgi:hypothetical protein
VKSIRAGIILSLMVAAVASVQGTERYVAHSTNVPGGGYTSWSTAASNIQDAVTAAAKGDTILVGPGRYTGANSNEFALNVFYVYGKPMTIRSSAGAAVTIIDGAGATRGAWMGNDGASGPYILDGFTVSNCYTTSKSAGVRLYNGNTAVTSMVKNCVIMYCTSTDGNGAGGVGTDGTAGANLAVVSNCVVRNNTGGGVFHYAASAPQRMKILDCRIENNTGRGLTITGWGGTNYTWNTVIRGNVNGVSLGAGVYHQNLYTDMRNCLITHNRLTVNTGGAAIYSYDDGGGSLNIYNCTIASNRIPLRWYGGAGVGVADASTLHAWNTICVSNISENGYTEDFVYGTAPASFTNCCTSTSYFPGQPPPGPMLGTNNIAADPKFLNPATGDYHLPMSSPCVNSGLYQTWMTGATDLDRNRRLDRAYGLVDRGCYELPISAGTAVSVR